MEIILIIMAILLLFFASVLMLKLRLTVEYDSEVRAYLGILFFKIQLYPKKKKKIKLSDYETRRFKKRQEKERKKAQKLREKQKKQAKKASKKKKSVEKEEKEAWTLERILETVELTKMLIGRFFSKFTKHLRLDIAKIHINVASDDPAKTAMYYGLISQSVVYLVEILDQNTRLFPKNDDCKDIIVRADFLSQKMTLDIKATASLRLWQILDTALSTVYEYLKSKYLGDLE